VLLVVLPVPSGVMLGGLVSAAWVVVRPSRVAVARKLLTLVYYGLRDGEIRCVADQQAA
jgi:hypothetical protein